MIHFLCDLIQAGDFLRLSSLNVDKTHDCPFSPFIVLKMHQVLLFVHLTIEFDNLQLIQIIIVWSLYDILIHFQFQILFSYLCHIKPVLLHLSVHLHIFIYFLIQLRFGFQVILCLEQVHLLQKVFLFNFITIFDSFKSISFSKHAYFANEHPSVKKGVHHSVVLPSLLFF